MNKKILVTGGAGFIGGNFIRYIKKNFPEHNIVNIDKNGYASNPEFIKGLCENYKIDISREVFSLKGIFKEEGKFDYIFHFAAESHVDNSIDGPTEFTQSNIVGTQNILEEFRKQNYGKFIHISTDEVYGHLGFNDPSFTEHTPIEPRSPYAASKASSDLLCLSYINTYNCNICITRCCNNYGINQHKEKFIPTIVNSLLNNKKIPVYGEGTNIREWIHVDDHNYGVWLVAVNGKPGVYNIGSGEELSNIELVDIICKKMGKDLDDSVQFVTDRPGHDFRYSINCLKIQKELLFQCNKPYLERHIDEVIEYYKNKTR